MLGPIAPQLPRVPLSVPGPSLLRVAREKSKDEIEDATWILIDQAEKHMKQLEEHIATLLEAFPAGAKFRSVQWLPGKKKEEPARG